VTPCELPVAVDGPAFDIRVTLYGYFRQTRTVQPGRDCEVHFKLRLITEDDRRRAREEEREWERICRPASVACAAWGRLRKRLAC
jgi:hypothetical protein